MSDFFLVFELLRTKYFRRMSIYKDSLILTMNKIGSYIWAFFIIDVPMTGEGEVDYEALLKLPKS